MAEYTWFLSGLVITAHLWVLEGKDFPICLCFFACIMYYNNSGWIYLACHTDYAINKYNNSQERKEGYENDFPS